MNIQQFRKLIDRYLRGEATKVEKEAIDAWFEDERQYHDRTASEAKKLEKEMLFNIRTRLQIKENLRRPSILRFPRWLGAAAALLLIGAVSLCFYIFRYSEPVSQELVTFRTPQGHKAKLVLSDGSTLWLNSNTSVRYPKAFHKESRLVYVDKGEAFFDIKHESKRPFLVHARELTTQVLGTSFDVALSSESRQITVTVNTGKVSVYPRQAPGASGHTDGVLTLLPDHSAVYDVEQKSIKLKPADAYSSMAWKDNVLIFKDAGLQELKARLEDWYKVKVIFAREVDPRCLITARFDNPSLAQVLISIKEINGYDFSINGEQIIIQNKSCN